MSDTTFLVTISRTIETTVPVTARDANAARHLAERTDFTLPPVDEWQGQKDWRFVVADADGNTLIDEEGNDTTGE